MVLQTAGNYPEQLGLGIEGSFADTVKKVCVTGVNETEAMPFGRMVQFDAAGTIDRSVKLANAVERFHGITGFTHSQTKTGVELTGVAQVSTVTVAAVALADGDTFRITLTYPDGSTSVHEIIRVGGVPADVNAVAAAMRLDINNDATASLLVVATGAAAAVIITSLEAGSFGVLTEIVDGGGTPTLVHALTTGGEPDGIRTNEEANILRKGTIWLRPEDAVTPASGVFVRITANAGVGTALGAFRGADDGGNTEDLSAVAHWVTSSEGGADGGLAKLEINLD